MAPSGTPENQPLAFEELETKDELVEDAISVVEQKLALVSQEEEMVRTGLGRDNPEILMIEQEIQGLDAQLNRMATQWAELKIGRFPEDPEKRARQIENKKERFMKKVVRTMKRQDRQENRQERRGVRKGTLTSTVRSPDGTLHTETDVRFKGKINTPEGRAKVKLEVHTEADYHAELTQLSTEVQETLIDQSSTAMTVQRMLEVEPRLTPSDLIRGDRQMEAVSVVFADNPRLAALLKEGLSEPEGSPRHQDAIARLTEIQSTLGEAYNVLSRTDVAKEKLEEAGLEGTLIAKIKKVAHEVTRSPEAMIAGVVGVIGLFMLRKKIFTKEVKEVLGWTALGVAGVVGTDFVLDKVSPDHRGIWDRIGMNPNNLATGKIVGEYRNLFVGMPKEDEDALDDMIRVLDVPMEVLNDLFRDAVLNHKKEIDTSKLLGHGVDSSTEKQIDGGSLFNALSWFYGKTYQEKVGSKANAPKITSKDEQLLAGVDWSEDHLKGQTLATANYIVNVRDTIGSKYAGNETAPDGNNNEVLVYSGLETTEIQNPHLLDLIERDPEFYRSLKQLPSGEILIKGYPFEYRFNEQGEHVFKDAINTTESPVKVSDTIDGDARHRILMGLVAGAELDVTKEFAPYSAGLQAGQKLEYDAKSGAWELKPALDRIPHDGLAGYKKEEKVPFYFTGTAEGFDLRLKGSDKAFENLAQVQEEFDLQRIFPELVRRDLGHLLGTMPFTVEKCVDSSADSTSTLTIVYGDGHRGQITYKNDVAEGISLDDDARLQSHWEMEARKDTRALLSKSTLQDRIISAIGVNPDVYTRWHNIATSGVVSAEPNVEFTGGVFGTVGKTLSEMMFAVTNSNNVSGSTLDAEQKLATENSIDQQLGDLVATMHKELVTDLYMKGYSKVKFDQEKARLLDGYEAKLNTILGTKVDLDLNAEKIELKKDEAEARLAEALAPLNDASWQTDQVQERLYKDLLAQKIGEVSTAIDALRLLPGQTAIKESQVDAVIEAHVLRASRDASAHRGLEGAQSKEVLLASQLNGAHKAQWKGPSERVYSYLADRFDWKPEQIAQLMKMYFANIKNGDANPALGPANAEEEYTKYYLSSVYAIMGGKEGDWWDRGVQFVTEDFNAHKAQFQGIKSYEEWVKNPELRPTPPGLEDSKESYKLTARASFVDWFDKNMELSTWTRLEGEWPNTFRDYTMQRLDRIVQDDALTTLELDAQLKRFAQFVGVEYYLYKICVDGTYNGWTEPEELRDRITDRYFDPVWADPHKDYKDYARILDPQFGEHIKGEEYGLLTKFLAGISSKLIFPDARHWNVLHS